MTASFCTFDGTAVAVRVEGTGRAVLVEPAPFKDGHLSHVFLPGATIVPGMPNPRIERPAALHPLGLNPAGQEYKIEYNAGRPTTISVQPGGTDGGYAGPLTSGVVCPPSWCPVVWSGSSKKIIFSRDTDDGFAVAKWFPYGVEGGRPSLSRVSRIELEGASGVLHCDERSHKFEGNLSWNAGPLGALALRGPDVDGPRKGLWIKDSRLHLHIENDVPPQSIGGAPLASKLLGLTGAVGVLLIAFLVVRRGRRRLAKSSAKPEPVVSHRVPPVRVFVSFVSPDAEHLRKLLNHLSSLKAEERIAIFSQADLQGGEDTGRTKHELEQAQLILLLVSAEYIANDSVQEQLSIAMKMHSKRQARVIPIVVRPVDYSGAAFSALQPLPHRHSEEDPQAVSSHPDQDRAWAAIATHIRRVVAQLRSQEIATSPATDQS